MQNLYLLTNVLSYVNRPFPHAKQKTWIILDSLGLRTQASRASSGLKTTTLSSRPPARCVDNILIIEYFDHL